MTARSCPTDLIHVDDVLHRVEQLGMIGQVATELYPINQARGVPACLGRSRSQESWLVTVVTFCLVTTPTWITVAAITYACLRFSLSPWQALPLMSVSVLVSVYTLYRLDGDTSRNAQFRRAVTLDSDYLVTPSARRLQICRFLLAANLAASTATTIAFARIDILAFHLTAGVAVTLYLALQHQHGVPRATRVPISLFAAYLSIAFMLIAAAGSFSSPGWRAGIVAATIAVALPMEPKLFHANFGIAITATSAKNQIRKLEHALASAGHAS